MMTIEKKSLKVGKYVDTDHVDTVVRTYKQERWIQNSERIGKADSRTVWYSIEELEEFLATAKEQGADGLRVYFGVYPADFAPKPEYAGRQTTVFVATKRKETETGSMDKDLYITTEKGTSILAYNAGQMCPPYCTGTGGRTGNPEIGITIIDNGENGLTVI